MRLWRGRRLGKEAPLNHLRPTSLAFLSLLRDALVRTHLISPYEAICILANPYKIVCAPVYFGPVDNGISRLRVLVIFLQGSAAAVIWQYNSSPNKAKAYMANWRCGLKHGSSFQIESGMLEWRMTGGIHL